MSITAKDEPQDFSKLKHYIRNRRQTSNDKITPYLDVVIGGPAMILDNPDTLNGIANGTFCTFAKVILKATAQVNISTTLYGYVPCVYAKDVKCILFKHVLEPYKNIQILDEYPVGYFKVGTSSMGREISFGSRKVKCNITGFRVKPRFAITGHKTQGMTMASLFIAGIGNYGTGKDGWLYIALSRVKDLSNIYILTKLSENLKDYNKGKVVVKEDRRLHEIAAETTKLFDL